jgi:hypothetical protein
MGKIAPDKWKHFYVGIAMGAVLQALSVYLLPDYPVAGTIAVLVAVIAISYGFELVSLVTGKGHHDVMDAIASILGGIVGMGLTIALILLTW